MGPAMASRATFDERLDQRLLSEEGHEHGNGGKGGALRTGDKPYGQV